MTRIIGQLDGADGPLNGRLFIKAGGSFIGAPEKELVFLVDNGKVDIELPPCPPALPYLVDYRERGDMRRLVYVERWRIKAVEEMSLDEARGLVYGTVQRREGKGDAIEAMTLRNELQEVQEQKTKLELRHAKLLRKLGDAECRAAAAQAQSASLSAALMKEKAKGMAPEIVIEERVVEKRVTKDEHRRELAEYRQQIELLKQRNAELEQNASAMVATTTHFTNLHAEIDRLNSEKQQLLLRIEELKNPVRRSSSLRNEAIANLNKLTDG